MLFVFVAFVCKVIRKFDKFHQHRTSHAELRIYIGVCAAKDVNVNGVEKPVARFELFSSVVNA